MRRLAIPHYFLLALFLVLPVRWWLRRRAYLAHCCRGCGCNLRAESDGPLPDHCPDCGLPVPAKAPAVVRAAALTAGGGTVETDLPCVHCDYNLRFQPSAGLCPECGRPVQETLTFPRLQLSGSRWLSSLSDSTSLLLASAVAAIAIALVPLPRAAAVCAVALPWALMWFAVWLLTRREPDEPRWNPAHLRAWAMRLAATGSLLMLPAPRDFHSGRLLLAVGGVCAVIATFLYFSSLRLSAARLPSAGLVRWATAASGIVPLSLAISLALSGAEARLFIFGPLERKLLALPLPVVGSPADVVMYGRMVKDGLSLNDLYPIRTGISAAGTVLALVVLLQFRIAFGRAFRQARQRISSEPSAASGRT